MNIYTGIPPTYLYIKQHSITGLKYFGKTTKSDPYKYKGSGTRWLQHIKKHGMQFVETIWLSEPYTDKLLIQEIALHFSEENNIVESKEWANLILENGLDGGNSGKGRIVSEETRAKLSNAAKNMSDETRAKIAAAGKKRIVSKETREKIAAAGKKRIVSKETREKMSLAAINMSGESRANITAAKRNITEETKAKMSASAKVRTRRPHTAETKAKIKDSCIQSKKTSIDKYYYQRRES